MNELHAACASGDLKKVIKLLKTKDINQLHAKEGKSPLCFAIKGEHWQVVDYLLSHDAKIIDSTKKQTLDDKRNLLKDYKVCIDILKNKNQFCEAISFLGEAISFCEKNIAELSHEKMNFTVMEGLVRVEELRKEARARMSRQQILDILVYFDSGIKQFRVLQNPTEEDKYGYFCCLEYLMIYFTQGICHQMAFFYIKEAANYFQEQEKLALLHFWLAYMNFSKQNYAEGIDYIRKAIIHCQQITDFKDEMYVMMECNELANVHLKMKHETTYEDRIINFVANCFSNLPKEMLEEEVSQYCVYHFYILYSEITNPEIITPLHLNAYDLLQKAMALMIEVADSNLMVMNKEMNDYLKSDKCKIQQLMALDLKNKTVSVSSVPASLFDKNADFSPIDEVININPAYRSSL